MKTISRFSLFANKVIYGLRTLIYSTFFTYLILLPYAAAAPSGGRVVGGTGNISQSGLNTTINQNSGSMAIDWNTFNVNANERVNFIQPNARSIALNRILDSNASQIRGMINANGQVVLVNPNGIFFAQGAVVNVGGLIASGLDIDPIDFMNGDYVFSELAGTDGQVVNSGIINASLGGSVTLLGQQVKNEGLIAARLGAVNMAAGKEAIVTFDNAGLVGVKITREILQEELGIDPAVLNTGEINAEGGRILISGSVSQDIFTQAVNTGDIEQATSVVMHQDGTFTLGAGADVVNEGTLSVSTTGSQQAGQIVVIGENVTNRGEILADAANSDGGDIELHASDRTLLIDNSIVSARSESNGKGGNAKILGNHVGLFDYSIVDVSGNNGGGDVLIGGGFQGSNLRLRNAQRTYVNSDSRIIADAIQAGSGGLAVVWADEITRYYGDISARGGSYSGDGGLAEVSGKEYLDFNGAANLSSSTGNLGTLLLDPLNITIGNVPNANRDTVSENDAFNENPNDSVLFDATQINDILDMGTNVELQARENITVDREINVDALNTSSNLTLRAGDSIFVNEDIFIGSGDLLLVAGSTGCDPTCAGASDRSVIITGGDLDTLGSITILAADNMITDDAIGAGAEGAQPSSLTIRAGNDITFINNNSNDIVLTNGDINITAGDVTLETDPTNPTVIPDGIATGVIDIDQEINSSGADDQNGGSITIASSIGSIDISSTLISNGGDASDSGAGNAGRAAGSITLLANNTTVANNITVAGAIMATGSDGNDDSNVAPGFNGGRGGDVQIRSSLGSVNVVLVDSGGGNGEANDGDDISNGGDAGSINITAGSITLGGGLLAQGGTRGTNDLGEDGRGNSITLDGPVTLSDDITVNTTRGALSGMLDNDGRVSFLSTVDGAQSLTVESRESVIFDDIVTNLSALTVTVGENFTANGAITATGTIDINGDSENNIFTVALGANINGSNVTIDGNEGNDRFNILAPVANGVLSGNDGGDIFAISANVNTVNGNAGADTFSINVAGLTPTISGGGASDTLTAGYANNSDWVINGIDSGGDGSAGTLTSSLATLAFSGIETLNGGSGADSFVLSGGNAVIDTINGGGSIDTLTARNIVNQWNITANNEGSLQCVSDAACTFGGVGLINPYVSSFSSIESLQGGFNDDTFVFTDGASISNTVDAGAAVTVDTVDLSDFTTVSITLGGALNGVSNAERIIGNNTASTLQGQNIANMWAIQDFDGGGTVADGINDGSIGGIQFVGFNNLIGGSADDSFVFSGPAASISGRIDGGLQSTRDTADFSAVTGAVNVALGGMSNAVLGVELITGNNTNSTLQGENVANTWVLQDFDGGLSAAPNGINDGTVAGIFFVDFNNLVGGSNNDDFTFVAGTSLTGNINGGDQSTADTVDLSALATADITLGTGDGAVQDIELITGNDNATTSILRGDNAVTTWMIEDFDGALGTVADGMNDGIVAGTQFVNFHNLIGGTNDDSFEFQTGGSITGTVNGGGQATADTVDFSNLMTTVDITLGGAINGVDGAERIVGNGMNSTLRGANDLISITDWNIQDFDGAGMDADGVDDGVVAGIQFVNFSNLVGGSGDDSFNFANGSSINGIVDAGGEVNSDTVNLSALMIVDITLGGNLNGVQNAERIIGNDTASTLRGDNIVNNWMIEDFDAGTVADGSNDGTLGGIEFVNFNNLVGGTNDDSFIFSVGSSILGSVDGGDQMTADTVDLSALAAVDITVGGAANGVVNAERVIGNDTNSTLRGADVANTWRIEDFNPADLDLRVDGINDGTVAGIEFVNFNNLVGGSNDDNFIFAAIGSIAGNIDAGGEANADTVDLSALAVVDVTLNGSMINAVQNAERVIGNNTVSTFRGGDVINAWSVSDFDAAGTVADGINDGTVGGIQFVDFNNLVGGNNVDTFDVSGTVNGTINGGAQDDVLNVTLSGVESGSVTFVGGAGSDSVNLLGGAAGYSGNYNSAVGLNDQFVYTNAAAIYTVNFRESEIVQDDLTASNLTVNGTVLNDTISLGNNSFSVNASTTVNYSNKTDLSVFGGTGSDTVDINMDINLNGTLAVNAESLFLSNAAGSTITADTLELDSISSVSVSSAAGTIQTVINNIELNDVAGPVSIDETDGINISRFNNVSAAFDLVSQTGNITSSAALNSNAVFSVEAINGSIDLRNSNQLSGSVSLLAAGDTVVFRNIIDTVLGAVNSQTLTVTSTGSITGTGNVDASGSATFSSAGDISLSGTNDVSVVTITTADSVSLNTSNAISVSGISSTGNVDIVSAAGGLTVAGTIDSGADVNLEAGTGAVVLDSIVTAGNALAISGAQIAQNTNLIASDTIDVVSTQGITMSGSATSTSANANIRYSANDDVNVTLLSAANGTAAITSSNGAIIDINGNSNNLVASRVELMANDGIGSGDAVETQTSTLSAANGTGNVQIDNSGLITLEALQNSGDITFVNDDTINITSGSVDAGLEVGALVMRTTNGDFLGVGSADPNNPDITARDGTFVGTGNFGTALRPLVLNIRDSVLISTRVSFDPIFFPNQPNDVRNNSDLQFSGLDTLSAIAGEQLVEVETLGEIDPAIFTSIRNYALDEIAIRLPRDQLYEDDFDE